MSDQFVVISGYSGGGKSTLLAELARRGHPVVPEPGRRIVAEAMPGDGAALPWVDLEAFANRAIAMAVSDHEAARSPGGWTFFDRGLVDAVAALAHATGRAVNDAALERVRYHPVVFMAPPWPALFAPDAERRHGFEDAVAEYDRLLSAYQGAGYRVQVLPKISVTARADVLERYVAEQARGRG